MHRYNLCWLKILELSIHSHRRFTNILFVANVARLQIDRVRRFACVASFYCEDGSIFWLERMCNRYQSACLTAWCIARPWLPFGTVLSGFDLCPDEDVFEAFWSSECYHWLLISQGKYSWALCLFQWFASACQCLVFWGILRICILGVHVFVCCLLW